MVFPSNRNLKAIAERQLPYVLAQLRHAYAQLAAGAVKDQKQFADGLIAPQIKAIEKIASFSDQ